jgi:hypothetical protein
MTFQYVETRWQIALFVILAALFEYGARAQRAGFDWTRFGCNCAAATFTILSVKWYLEGISPSLLTWVGL